MKNTIKYLLFFAFATLLSSCMDDVGDFTVKGEAITGFELTGPENNDTITINTGALTETYTFSWQKAESGLASAVKYSIVFDKTDGDFSKPLWSKAADNTGASNTATLTFQELQQVYTAAGTGVVAVKWNVKAENGSPNVKMGKVANVLKMKVTADGVSNFTLVSPKNKSVLQFDGNFETQTLAFDWNDATSTKGSVTYKFFLDKLGGDFSNPILALDADNSGKTSKVSMTQAQWKTLLESKGVKEGSYIWTVKAKSSDLEWTKETFEVYFEFINWRKPIFIVGEATSVGWDIGKALEMTFIAPNVWSGVFELKAGKEFKFFPEKGSWDNGIGADRFKTFIGCTGISGGNIKNNGTKDGNYIVIADLNTQTLTVTDSPKILGGSVAADWNTANAVPLQDVGSGIYDTYQYITVDGWGFKFVPTNGGWDGDFGKSKTAEGKLIQDGEDNLTVAKDGFYRVRVNMTNMTYELTETSWGIIGSGAPGGWDTDTNMTMTNAKGEYVLKADITLKDGEIKFRANDDWAINLGDDNTDGTLEYGGKNIPVKAGNYHIELKLNSATGFTYTITAK